MNFVKHTTFSNLMSNSGLQFQAQNWMNDEVSKDENVELYEFEIHSS